ncbi:sugar ABC transporter substrate-binding protein [Sandaracinomonas limnophila]|uniref:Sugar ABC transporter substrate-binding protein n=1 Tax=Sandaracinomonas limnophila TaxID=1862386 RepID=A0A437PM97_9BACT|nr:substrate-binding domain-containing protein [Sandaracinomonas limnophila]RVU23403.1 sugar ABC transporter substrate-binding protein [Sandaracinomonas limnophila]
MKFKYIFLAFIGFFIFSCGQKKSTEGQTLRIGVSMLSLQNEFVLNVSQSLEKYAKENKVELIVVDAERSSLKQIEQVENFINQQVDAIILNPCEFEASSPAIIKAKKAGIPIVNVNSSTKEKPDAFVGSDDKESAKLAIEFIAKKLNGKGNIVIIQGYLGQAAQIDRDLGAKDALKKYPNLKVLATQTGEWDRAKAMSLMENWIQLHGKNIQAVFAHNDEMGLGAAQALMDKNLKSSTIVVSVDGIADARKAVKAKKLDATILQDAENQGKNAIQLAIQLAKKQKPKNADILIPFQVEN